jgi:hypothetical protein
MRRDWLTREAGFINRNATQYTRGHDANVPEPLQHSYNAWICIWRTEREEQLPSGNRIEQG